MPIWHGIFWGGPFGVWSPPVERHQLKLSKVVSEEQNIQNELVALHMQDGRQQEDTSVWLVIPKIQELESEQATGCASSFRCQCHFGKRSSRLLPGVPCRISPFLLA